MVDECWGFDSWFRNIRRHSKTFEVVGPASHQPRANSFAEARSRFSLTAARYNCHVILSWKKLYIYIGIWKENKEMKDVGLINYMGVYCGLKGQHLTINRLSGKDTLGTCIFTPTYQV